MKLVLVVVALAACGGREAPARWETDEATAFARARTEHAPVLIQFYARWAVPSVELDRLLHAADLTGFVPLTIDTSEESATVAAARERYRATAIPSIVVVDASGRELGRIDQLPEAAELDHRLGAIRSQLRTAAP